MSSAYVITIANSTLISLAREKTLSEYRRLVIHVPSSNLLFPLIHEIAYLDSRELQEIASLIHDESEPEGRREVSYMLDFMSLETVTEPQLLFWALYAPPRIQIFMDGLADHLGER